MTAVGELALWVSLFLAVWGSAASVVGEKLQRSDLLASSRRAVVAATITVGLACVGVWQALLAHDFSLDYVTSHTTLNTPTLYLLIALWGGPAGRLLFLALGLALCATIAGSRRGELDPSIHARVVGTMATLLALLLLVICFGTNPYDRVEWVPAEGQGLDPQLQTPLAGIYFISTYLGYVAASAGLALGVSAALVGRIDSHWLTAMRRWCAASWCLLTVAVAVRMRWSYLEPVSSGFRSPGAAQITTGVVCAMSFALLVILRARDGPAGRSMWTRARRAGAATFALGLALIVTGVAASRLWTDRSVTLNPGESAELLDRFGQRWRFVSQGASRDEQMNHLSTSVALEVWRNRNRIGFVSAERRQYLDSMQRPTFEPTLRPGLQSLPGIDVYVLLAGLRGDAADLRVGFRPLVGAVWIGWLLVAVGGLLVAAPTRRGGRALTGNASRV